MDAQRPLCACARALPHGYTGDMFFDKRRWDAPSQAGADTQREVEWQPVGQDRQVRAAMELAMLQRILRRTGSHLSCPRHSNLLHASPELATLRK